MNVEKQLKTLIEDITGKEHDDLSGKSLFEDLEFDSVSIMELVSEIEEKFGIILEEDELIDAMSTYDKLVVLIKNKRN